MFLPTKGPTNEPMTTSSPTASATTAPTATVHVVFLLDRSGSMFKIHADVVSGFNSFIEEQKAVPGACRFTLMQFDDKGMDYVHVAADLQSVATMKPSDFVPRGGTPLYDAIGRAIGDIDARNDAMVDKDVMLFIIFTDGEENSSKVHSRQDIFRMIEVRQGKGWTFTFLGANQNAYLASAGLGIAKGSTSNFAGDGWGTQVAYTSLSANTSVLRTAVFSGATPDVNAFYAGAGKAAEDDLANRPNQSPPPKAVDETQKDK